MKVQEVNEYMHRFLDGDLSESEMKELKAHLDESPASAAMFERLKRLNEDLAQLPKVTPPISIVDTILPRLQREAQAMPQEQDQSIRSRAGNRWRQAYAWFGGAAAAVLAITVFISTQLPGDADHDAAYTGSANQAELGMNTMASKGLATMEIQSAAPPEADAKAMDDAAAGSAPDADGEMRVQVTSESSAMAPMIVQDQHGTSSNSAEEPYQVSDAADRSNEGIVGEQSAHSFGFTAEEPATAFGIAAAPRAASHLSPDQLLHASVVFTDEGEQVVILDQEGKETYLSAVYEGAITNLQWSEDSRTLTFEIMAEAQSRIIVIDLHNRSERVQE